MTSDGWRHLVYEAIDRADRGDHELLDLVVQLLAEQDAAKQALCAAGFGVTGTPWQTVVDEVRRTGRTD